MRDRVAAETTEEREHGLSSISTWLLWFQRAGGIPFLAVHILFMTFDRGVYFAVEYWLARWTEGAYDSITVFGIEFAPQTDGLSAQADVSDSYFVRALAEFDLFIVLKHCGC